MIEILEKEDKNKFFETFNDNSDLKELLEKSFKILYKEDEKLYFSLIANEEEKSCLRKGWSLIKTRSLTNFNIKTLINVEVEDTKLLFLEKAVELLKAKEIKISLV